jgi:outer membrane protein assembly factor BamB
VTMRRALVLLAAGVVLGGCSSLNPMNWFSGPSGPTPAPLTPIANPQAVRVLWSASVGEGEHFVFSPALAGDSVYAAGGDGSVARFDATTGKLRWRISLDARLSAGVGSDGALAVVATDEGEVFALDAQNGRIRWRARVSSEVLAAPVVGSGLVLVRSGDSRIFAFAEQDGKRIWVYQRAPASLIIRLPAGVTIADDSAYAGFSGGKLVAIALENGGARWEGSVALPRGATELERITEVLGNPAVEGREVCAAAFQGRVACFDVSSGNLLWSRETSSLTGVCLDERNAYVSDDKGGVQALERRSGRSVWKQDHLANRRPTLPLPIGADVVVGDMEGYVHFLARESGAFVSRFQTDGSAIRAAPIRLPTGFLVQTEGGRLYALSP